MTQRSGAGAGEKTSSSLAGQKDSKSAKPTAGAAKGAAKVFPP